MADNKMYEYKIKSLKKALKVMYFAKTTNIFEQYNVNLACL